MTGLSPQTPQLIHIVIHQQSRIVELTFDDQRNFRLSFELLRVYSPSAEVRGHGAGPAVLQTGKRMVNIERIEPVGQYAIKPIFSDGHASGLYSWDYLYWLGTNAAMLWADYLERLAQAGASRDEDF